VPGRREALGTARFLPEHSMERRLKVSPVANSGPRGKWREWLIAYAFCLPAFLALFYLRVMPAGMAVWESFHQRSMFDQAQMFFVGFENYVFLFTESLTFLPAVKVTLTFLVMTVTVQTLAALALAVLFTQRFWGSTLCRTLVFLPITIPVAVSVVVWGTAFRGDGLVNALFTGMGLGAQPLLSSAGQALWCIIIMASWIGVGYWMVFLIAGLRDIPNELREAASLDGAGPIRTFVSIVLPLLKRPLAFVIVANTVANFLQFVPAQILTQGGPENSTRFLMFEIYSTAFIQGDTSLASTEIVMVLVVLLAIVGLQFSLLRAKD
jgi:multiple sugar transport system permease protein